MTTTRYLWNPINQNIIREYDSAGNTVASYTTEPDLYGDVVSQRRDGQDSVYHYDGQGSTLALTNATGDVTDAYAYSAFGNVIGQSGTTVNPFQFIGQKGYYWNVAEGDYEVRRRPLQQSTSRWRTLDTIKHFVTSAYVYCANSPFKSIDPSGMISVRAVDMKQNPACGKDHWVDWLFRLDKEAPCDGFVVQQVVYVCRVRSECVLGCPLDSGTEGLNVAMFWEAWRIMKDELSPKTELGPSDHPHSVADDMACGEVYSYGIVRFFCEGDYKGVKGTGNLDELWKPVGKTYGKDRCSVTAKDLPSTGLPVPSFWWNTAVEGPSLNWYSLTWDCCPCHRTFVNFGASPKPK